MTSEAVATEAVHAAAVKFWELKRKELADAGAPNSLPEFEELSKLQQMEVKNHVLPVVWAALETIPEPPKLSPEWGRRMTEGLLKGQVSSVYPSPREALENMQDDQELVVRTVTGWQLV